MSDLQLNILIPKKKDQEKTAAGVNSRKRHFEQYKDRKKKRQERSANHGSILRPKISKDHPFQGPFSHNIGGETVSESAPPRQSQRPAPPKKPILKKPFKKESLSEKPSNIAIEEEKEVPEEPEKAQYPSVFTSSDFEALSISPRLKKTLQANNYVKMTTIQQDSIPVLLNRSNSVIKSETGSGKTLCYLIPIYELLMQKPEKVSRSNGTLALIICPTRELCIQVDEEARKLSKAAIWIVNGAIMGGESIKKEKARLRKGVNILISTPGRLVYHLQNSQSFLVSNLEFLIMEESDRTLDMGFAKDVEGIVELLSKRTPQWDKVQKVLISANFSQKIKTLTLKMARSEMRYIGWDVKKQEKEEEDFFDTEAALKIPKSIEQSYAVIKEEHKIAFLINILRKARENSSKIMVFVSTIDETEFLSHAFQNIEDLGQKFKIFKLHGDIDQKTRTATYFEFKRKVDGFSVLIATEVASRGLDFTDVNITILTSVPPRPIDYVNAIGRTGRIDRIGQSILLIHSEELKYLEELKANGIEAIKKYREIKAETLEKIRREIVSLVRGDQEAKMMAKRAYVSSGRAYNRNQKGRFFLKALNLQGVAKSFGLEGAKYANDEQYQEENVRRMESMSEKKFVRKNVIKSVKELEMLEFG